MGRLLLRVVFAAAAIAVLGACGARNAERPAPAAPPPLQVRVYLIHDHSIRPVARRVRTRDSARAALAQLLAGPTPAERARGLTTAVTAAASARSLAVADGIAKVRLSPSLDSPEGRAQVVYTLTQFPTIRSVVFGDGRPLRRADFERQTPPLLVESPLPGARVTSPLRVRGTANAFEATFQADLVAADGKLLAHKTVMATSGSGQRGTFDEVLRFARGGAAKLVVYENSAADGSRIHEVEVPLQLRP